MFNKLNSILVICLATHELIVRSIPVKAFVQIYFVLEVAQQLC
jgi:hypothetical protein